MKRKLTCRQNDVYEKPINKWEDEQRSINGRLGGQIAVAILLTNYKVFLL